MLRLILLISILLFFSFISQAQICSPDCRSTLTNYTGNIKVTPNDVICITGSFSGNIEMKGGILHICGNAQIQEMIISKYSEMYFERSAIITIQNFSGNDEFLLSNKSDSVVITQSSFNQPFTYENSGICRITNSTINSEFTLNNTGIIYVNSGVNINAASTINNSKIFEINGSLNLNAPNIVINNNCQMHIKGNMSVNGATIITTEGYLRVDSTLTENSGSIKLTDASIFYVNSMSVNSYIEGIGTRSTIAVTNNPNLNVQSAIRGNISLCVKTGNFTAVSGTVTSPATVDCNNPVGSSNCNPESFGYDAFKLNVTNAIDWTNTSNWMIWNGAQFVASTNGRYPTKSSVAIIPDGKTITATQSVEVRKLMLGETTGGNMILTTGGMNVYDTLQFNGTGKLILSQNKLFVTGKVLGTANISGSTTAEVSLQNSGSGFTLKMDNTLPITSTLNNLVFDINSGIIVLSDTLRIKNTLNPISGSIQTNNKLILLSDNNLTASVLKGTGNYISGNVKVQRYIPAITRRYRFLASPVNTTMKDWQNEIYITGNNAAGNATGNTPGQFNSAGFDATASNNPSLYIYDETQPGTNGTGWVAVTNETSSLTSLPLNAGKGFRFFVRGDRSDTNRLNGINNTQNEVTLDVNGALIKGNYSTPITWTNNLQGTTEDGWNLIGNPYAAMYDWNSSYKDLSTFSKLEASIWIFNAKANSYVSYNALSHAGSLTKGLIPSGQSFWIRAFAANPSLTFKEDYKTADIGVNYLKYGADNPSDQIDITFVKDSVTADQVSIKYINGASKNFDQYDNLKLFNTPTAIAAFGNDTVYLDLSCRPIDYTNADIVPIYISCDASGNYKLELRMSPQNIVGPAKAYLLDDYTKKYLDISITPSYNFSIDLSDPLTSGFNRFYVLYFPSQPQPVTIDYLFANKLDSSKALISWGTSKEPRPVKYTLQRGLTTAHFTSLYTTNSTGSPYAGAHYQFIDSTIDFSKINYYRVAIDDSINPITYSTIIQLDLTTGIKNILLKDNLRYYPNPTSDVLNIGFGDKAPHGTLHARIFDITGKLFSETELTELTPNAQFVIPVSMLDNGMYILEVNNKQGEQAHFKFLKN